MVMAMFIAHRGVVSKGIEENTLPAFSKAIKSAKYAGFELDVYMSKDKEFVVYHDPLLAGKFIWHYKYKELKQKGIVKLSSVLNLKTDKIILIDIKDLNLDIAKFAKLLAKYKKQNIYVMSFFNSVIKKFKKPSFKVGVLNYILNSTSTYNYDFIGLLYDVATPHMLASFKKLDIEVFLYALAKKDKYIYDDVYYIIDACFLGE